MKYATVKKRLLVGLTALFLANLLLLIGYFFAYIQERKETWAHARDQAQQEAIRATEVIDQALSRLVLVNQSLTKSLNSGTLDYADIPQRLIDEMEANPFLLGVGVAFTPYSFDPERRLYSPLYVRRSDTPQMVQIEDSYDYTEQGRDWYHLPLKLGPVWQEPHFGEASNHYLANYTAPFHPPDQPDGEPIGVVFTSMSLDQYQALVQSLDLGDTGYGFILSKKGAFVAHPIHSYVMESKTIFELAEEVGDETLADVGRQAADGKQGYFDYQNELTGESAWIFVHAIPSTGWSMGVVYYNGGLLDTHVFREKRFNIGIMTVTAAFLFFILIIARLNGIERTLQEAWLAAG